MMLVEQACRFNVAGKGYMVVARSGGFTSGNEGNLGNIFNDVMNPLFAKPGQSVLTCGISGEDAFLACNTMRSDMNGRPTIFTHTYVMNAEVYARQMEREPAAILGVPMAGFLKSQVSGGELEPLELEGAAPMDLTKLGEKYALTPERYSRLLLGAYQAITGNRSLCLRTRRPLEETEQMVRELVYCISQGLLPALRRRLTYSSAGDTRMTVCVSSAAGGGSVGNPELVFGVEPDISGSVRPTDEMMANLFRYLGGCPQEERQAVLLEMQDWLKGIMDLDRGVPMQLVMASFYLSGGRKVSVNELGQLLWTLLKISDSSVHTQAMDRLLAGILNKLTGMELCPVNILDELAERYLRNASRDYCEALEASLALADGECCGELAQQLLRLGTDLDERQSRLLLSLLGQVPADAPEMTDELAEGILRWALQKDITAMDEYCAVLLRRYNGPQLDALICAILEGAEGRVLSNGENARLASLLQKQVADQTVVLRAIDDGHCRMLDRHCGEYSDALLESALDYLFQVRLSCIGSEEGKLRALRELEQTQPDYADKAKAQMAAGRPGTELLWEAYQAQASLPDGSSFDNLVDACSAENTFQNPNGVFEKRVAALWQGCVEAYLKSLQEPGKKAKLSKWGNALSDNLDRVRALRVSQDTRAAIGRRAADYLWNTVEYPAVIAELNYHVPVTLRRFSDEKEPKLHFQEAAYITWNNPRDYRELMELVQMADSMESLRELSGALSFLAMRMLRDEKRKFLSWDLLLLSCYRPDMPVGYDLDELVKKVEILEKNITPEIMSRSPLPALVSGNELLRKELCKLAGGHVPEPLQLMAAACKTRTRAPGPAGRKSVQAPGGIRQAPGSTRQGAPTRPPEPRGPAAEKDRQPQRGGLFSGIFGSHGGKPEAEQKGTGGERKKKK